MFSVGKCLLISGLIVPKDKFARMKDIVIIINQLLIFYFLI